jgi:hypothetical protein
MRPRLGLGLVVLLGRLLLAGMLTAAAQALCEGLYTGKAVAPEELTRVLARHREWLRRQPGGQQANLCGAHLAEADLRGAHLEQAHLEGAYLRQAHLVLCHDKRLC